MQDTQFSVVNGVDQYYYNEYTGREYIAIDGSSAAPVTTAGPTMKVSRYELMNGSQNGGTVNNEANAAFESIAWSAPGTTMQVCAGYFASTGQATTPGVDALGLCAQGRSHNSTGAGIGLYAEGRNEAPVAGYGAIIGAEIRVTNLTQTDKTYSPLGAAQGAATGVWVTADTGGNYGGASLCGLAFGTGNVAGTQWDVGYACTGTSVKSTAFRDDTNSSTVFAATGSHQYGVDFSQAQCSGPMLRTGQNSVEITGNVYLDGVINPNELTTNTNDWNIAQNVGNVFRVYSSASVTVTGIAGGTNGRRITLFNTGSNPIALVNQNSGGQPANQFALKNASETLAPGGSVTLYYDGMNSRWRIMSLY